MQRPNIFQKPAAPRGPATPSPVPELVMAQVRQARAMQEAGRIDEAAAVYRAVLKAYPSQVDCLHYLGVCEQQRGHLDEAVGWLERAVASDPSQAAVHANLAAALLARGQAAEALARADRGLALDPAMAGAQVHRAGALQLLGRVHEALEAIDRAIALRPAQPRYRFRRAALLAAAGRLEEAREAFEAIVAARPREAAPLENLAAHLAFMGRDEEARAVLARAIALEPDVASHRLRHAVTWLPLVRDDDDGLVEARERFARETAALRPLVDARALRGGAEAVGDAQPYYLAYQDLDNRGLLADYGALCAALMAQWEAGTPSASATPPDRAVDASRRLRVGIVSAQVRTHPVWNAITRGWVHELDRTRFEVHVFHLGPRADAETALARRRAEAFHDGPHDLAGWVAAIRAAAPDVLLYPEIGMDAMTARLAALRLAPVQAASWGHPQTTGLPTIDAYLSADAMEPADAEAHYAERLVRLPGLGACVEPAVLADEAVDLADFGVPAGAPVYVCPGTPYKYTPRHDALFVALAQALPDACLLLFRHERAPTLSDRHVARLRAAFGRAGLDLERHLRVVPWQSPARFRSLLAQATGFLDTVGFSGFNTVLEAVAAGLPVVTQRGRFLRGRLGSAVLAQLGLHELVVDAGDDAGYVTRAVRLAREPAWRAGVAARIAGGRDGLYRDAASIRALEDWITASVRG
jgi:predicted O-linked N-acetylglucosamine transferase (SPINDLY family)